MLVSINDLITYMDISFTLRQQDAAEMVLSGLQSEMEAFLRRPVEVDEFTETHVVPSSFQGVPATSFFYDNSLDTTGTTMNYIQPSVMISLRNTPVVSVSKVMIKNLSETGMLLGDTIRRQASISNTSYAANKVTYTTSTAHKFTVGQFVVVSGIVPTALNVPGRQILEVTNTTFVVDGFTSNPGARVSGGTASATGNDYTVQRYGVELYRGFPNDVVEITYTGGLNGDAESLKLFKLFILRAATREMQNMHDDVVGVKDLNPRNVAPLETGFTEKELLALRRYRRRRI